MRSRGRLPDGAPPSRRPARAARRGTAEAVVAALSASLLGAALVGAHGDVSYLHSCHAPGGVARLIPPPEGDKPCRDGEVLDEWVVRGPVTDGLPGARGPAGVPGSRGPEGRDGRPGPAYAYRVARTTARTSTRAGALTARCAPGELALSGGWSASRGVSTGSAARSGPGAWTVRPVADGSGTLSVYVVCAQAVTR